MNLEEDSNMSNSINNTVESFSFENGIIVNSLEEMGNALARMDYAHFESHVNSSKNDIANWVENSLKEIQLAKELRQTNSQNETLEQIYNHIKTSNEPHELIEKEAEDLVVFDKDFAFKNSQFPNHTIEEMRDETIVEEKNDSLTEISKQNIEQKKEKENPSKKGFFNKIFSFFKPQKIDEEFINELFSNKQKDSIIIEKESLEIYEPEYLKTNVPGFDELITNGIPKGSTVLLCGGAGTGKTTLSLQLLNNTGEQDLKGLYLTFEEESSRLRSHMKNYGWDPIKMESEGKIKIVKMDPFGISRSIEALLAKASGELTIEIDVIEGIIPKDFKPDIIILDSLSSVASAFVSKEEGYRIYVEQLFTLFKKIGATSFLISEVEENANKYTRNGVEEFLADAVVVLYNLREKNVRTNAIEILKMRGTDHKKKIVPFKIIKGKGITVFPKESPFTL